MVRFIHTADLHLDSPFKGIRQLHPSLYETVYQATFESFHAIVTRAIEEEVDFLLISGDIYDEENQSVKAQARLRDELGRLHQARIPVFLSHGNHDFMGRDTLRLQLPDNVTIFGTEPETVELETRRGERVAITGFSYKTRWLQERMIQSYPQRHQGVDYHIGMLHGYLDGMESSEGVYAPFSLAELNQKQYDYWALGHIHKRQALQELPPVLYPGNTQGRNPNETGEKGALLVRLQKGIDPDVQFFPTAPVVWEEREVSLAGEQSLSGVYTRLEEEMAASRANGILLLLSLVLADTDSLPMDVLERIQNGDLLEGLNHQSGEGEVPDVYLYRLALRPVSERLLFSYDPRMQESFQQMGQELAEPETYQQKLKDLFEHTIIRRRFPELEQDENLRAAIWEGARQLLLETIAFEEGEEAN